MPILRLIGLTACLLAVPLSSVARDGVLDIVAPWEIGGTDPSRAGYVFTRLEVAETLVDVDAEARPVPGLASAWEVSEDQLTWRFSLRDDVRFHDGSMLTAQVAAHALETARDKPGILQRVPLAGIEAVDDRTLVLRLTEPFSPLLAALAHTSAQILAMAAFEDDGRVSRVIGTGPYRIDIFQPPQRLTAVYHEDYWGEAPAIREIAYLAAGRGETRALLAESGDADIVFTLDPASQARLARNPALSVHSVPIPRTVLLKLNAAHPALNDPRARQALSLAIDRAGIATGLLREPEAVADQLLPPGLGAWHLDGLPTPARDLQRAAALLGELGWEAGPAGMLSRDGEPLRLTLRTFPDRPELPLIATALQDQWRGLGVDLQLAIGNSSEIPAGHQDGSLELALLARNFALIPNPLGTLLQDYGPGGGDWGAMNWSDARLNEILQELRAGADPARASALRQEAAAILHEALPVIPITWYQQTAAVSRALENFSIDPFERSYRLSSMDWAAP